MQNDLILPAHALVLCLTLSCTLAFFYTSANSSMAWSQPKAQHVLVDCPVQSGKLRNKLSKLW